MILSCRLGRHSALPSNVRNLGLRVSQCRCCGGDLIHLRGRWQSVPRGFRIVWRRLDEVIAEAVPLKLVRNLPVARDRRGRGLGELARRAADLAHLVVASLTVAGWAIADRYRALRAAWFAPLEPLQLVLPLAMP